MPETGESVRERSISLWRKNKKTDTLCRSEFLFFQDPDGQMIGDSQKQDAKEKQYYDNN